MQVRDSEKLIIVMLTEIYEHLRIRGEIDPKFVRSAILSDNAWGLEWEYTGLFSGSGSTPPEVQEVMDILDMWDRVEESYDVLGLEDKKRVEKGAEPFGENPKFRGFDGNNETKHMGIARFLVKDLRRFARFKDRDMNSHMPMSLETYRRMLAVYKPLSASAHLGADNLISILREQTHPSMRGKA